MQRSPSLSSVSSDDNDDFSDWADPLDGSAVTKSFFDDTEHPTAHAALEHDKNVWKWSFFEAVEELKLNDYQRIRLINWIRRTKPSAQELASLSPSHELFSNDEYLIPVIENDPMLQLTSDDPWSDDESPSQPRLLNHPSSSTPAKPTSEVENLKQKLATSEAQIERLKQLLETTLEVETDDESSSCSSTSESESEEEETKAVAKGKGKAALGKAGKSKKPKRDDDTHYFDSYAHNDIHEIMLKDTTRTISYARFILGNPEIFKGAVVMDVGCGTGILSMFAARAGAKQVYAIEASALANKARENIKNNGLQDQITVIQGKVEEIQLPDGEDKVDIIISEWMGYMLLYESMLDSVLSARDRFLRPTGLMAPSQTRIVIAGITADGLIRDRSTFWDSIYGFDLSAMKIGKEEEGLVEDLDASELCTTECIIKDIDTHTATVDSLEFHSAFTLSLPSDSRPRPIRAFTTWFDTFFASSSTRQARSDEEVQIHRFANTAYAQPVEVPEERPELLSFTTGPRGRITHWKQVTFMLKKEVTLEAGQTIEGSFRCQKCKTNSRELDVEIHWRVKAADGTDVGAINYDVFKVC